MTVKKKLKKLNNFLRREYCGSKINPIGLRVGVIRDWEAKWYAEKDFASLLRLKIRKFIDNELKEASVSHVDMNVQQIASILQSILVSQEWLLVKAVQKLKNFVTN